MRVLFVAPYVPSPIRVRPYNFLRVLAGRHDITVVATGTKQDQEQADRLRSACREVHVVPLRMSRSIVGCVNAAAYGEPLQSGFCRSGEFDRVVTRLLHEQDFDAVHVEHLRAAHVERLLPAGTRTVFDSVDCISLLLERTLRSSHSMMQRALAILELSRCRSYEARLVRRFGEVVVTSPEDQDALKSLAPEGRVSVIANGVDTDYFRPLGEDHEPATLVFTGKMSYHANVTAVLHFVRNIYPVVKRTRPETRLRIAGSNPPRVIRDLTRDPSITVTGYLPDIRTALGRSTVAICPVTVKVGIQNKILEAMAMGLPVVSTRQGVTGLGALHGREILVADDSQEFAAHVCSVLDDIALRKRLGEAARYYVEGSHCWATAAHSLEELYMGTRVAASPGLQSAPADGSRVELPTPAA